MGSLECPDARPFISVPIAHCEHGVLNGGVIDMGFDLVDLDLPIRRHQVLERVIDAGP